jgi:hypothetical protein
MLAHAKKSVPIGPHAVFRSLEDAEAFQQAVSAGSGYPKRGVYAAAVEAAEGRPTHRFDLGRPPTRMKPDEGWTWVHALIRRHPNGRRFAFPWDAHVRRLARQKRVPKADVVATLSDEWSGAVEIEYARSAAEAVLKRFLFATRAIPLRRGGACTRVSPGFLDSELLQSVVDAPGSALHLEPRDFEKLVADVLVSAPHTAVLLGAHSKDAGADLVVASLDDLGPTVTLVQCKRYEKTVKESTVKCLLADVLRHAATGGLLVTSSDFSRGAASLRAQFMWRIQLWRGVDLLTRFEDCGLTPHVLGVGRAQ